MRERTKCIHHLQNASYNVTPTKAFVIGFPYKSLVDFIVNNSVNSIKELGLRFQFEIYRAFCMMEENNS